MNQKAAGPYDAFFCITQLRAALRQQQKAHRTERECFLRQFQQFRADAQAKIAEVQRHYVESLLVIAGDARPQSTVFLQKLDAEALRDELEQARLEIASLQHQVQLVTEERDELSKLCHQFAIQTALPAARCDPEARNDSEPGSTGQHSRPRARPHRQLDRANLPVQTRLVGDELDFRAVKVTVSEDMQVYKLTRNPVNRDGFLSLQSNSHAERELPALSTKQDVFDGAEGTALPFLSKSMASQRMYQGENIRLRNQLSEVAECIDALEERFSRVQKAVVLRCPASAQELALLEAGFKQFWSQFRH